MIIKSSLKGSYDIAKKNIILCIWCNARLFTRFKVKKTHYFPRTVHYCCSSLPRLSETRRFFQNSLFWKSAVCSDWPAISCIVIGRIPEAYLKFYGVSASKAILPGDNVAHRWKSQGGRGLWGDIWGLSPLKIWLKTTLCIVNNFYCFIF